MSGGHKQGNRAAGNRQSRAPRAAKGRAAGFRGAERGARARAPFFNFWGGNVDKPPQTKYNRI